MFVCIIFELCIYGDAILISYNSIRIETEKNKEEQGEKRANIAWHTTHDTRPLTVTTVNNITV